MIPVVRISAALVLIYAAWIVFRVVDDWIGIIAAVASMLLLPIAIPVVTVFMLFIPSPAAGPLAIWPAIVALGSLEWLAKRRGGSLVI